MAEEKHVSSNGSVLGENSNTPRWSLVALGSAILAVVLAGAWYAGRQSAIIQDEGMNSDLNRLTQQIASTRLQLEDERARRQEAEKALQAGHSPAANEQSQTQRQVVELEAEVNQYKTIVNRQQRSLADNLRLLRALSSPHAHLLVMKGAEIASGCTAYSLVVEKSRVVLVASNLPKLADEKQFQFWLIRSKDPKTVSAGSFSPDDENRAIVEFDEPSLVSNISGLEVTDEPRGGSSEPTGARLLTASAENVTAQ